MSNRAIEIHDSTLDLIVQSDAEATLHFPSMYIHQSEGTPGRDRGTVWIQRVTIRIDRPRISGVFSEFPVRLSDGQILLGDHSIDNVIPVSLCYEGRFELKLEAFRGKKEVVTIEGSGIRLELIGEAKYLEEFSP